MRTVVTLLLSFLVFGIFATGNNLNHAGKSKTKISLREDPETPTEHHTAKFVHSEGLTEKADDSTESEAELHRPTIIGATNAPKKISNVPTTNLSVAPRILDSHMLVDSSATTVDDEENEIMTFSDSDDGEEEEEPTLVDSSATTVDDEETEIMTFSDSDDEEEEEEPVATDNEDVWFASDSDDGDGSAVSVESEDEEDEATSGTAHRLKKVIQGIREAHETAKAHINKFHNAMEAHLDAVEDKIDDFVKPSFDGDEDTAVFEDASDDSDWFSDEVATPPLDGHGEDVNDAEDDLDSEQMDTAPVDHERNSAEEAAEERILEEYREQTGTDLTGQL